MHMNTPDTITLILMANKGDDRACLLVREPAESPGAFEPKPVQKVRAFLKNPRCHAVNSREPAMTTIPRSCSVYQTESTDDGMLGTLHLKPVMSWFDR